MGDSDAGNHCLNLHFFGWCCAPQAQLIPGMPQGDAEGGQAGFWPLVPGNCCCDAAPKADAHQATALIDSIVGIGTQAPRLLCTLFSCLT